MQRGRGGGLKRVKKMSTRNTRVGGHRERERDRDRERQRERETERERELELENFIFQGL